MLPVKKRYLLDTHVWIKSLSEPEKLSRVVRREIENPANELFLSSISVWEAALLAARGRLAPKVKSPNWLNDALDATKCLELPISFVVATEAARIRLPQNDIADVFLAATASALDLTLITSDRQLLDCGWLKTLADD